MILAERYRARNETGFEAYMALQRALLIRYVSRGGSVERWVDLLAPRFRERYADLLQKAPPGE